METKRLSWVYSDSPIYFLTLVAYERKWLFANTDVHAAFIGFAERATDCGVAVGRYVLMPDHIHLFAGFPPDSIHLSKWIKSLKNTISKSLNLRGCPAPHWQKGFFDHVLRSDESYDQKWDYVRQNPVRAGLVDDPDDWKFQGEICDLYIDTDGRRS
jgi:REP element-mobilizing transposase RayT